jgi:hypothetical protein
MYHIFMEHILVPKGRDPMRRPQPAEEYIIAVDNKGRERI